MSTPPAVASEALSTLRLTQTAEGEDRYRVEIALEGPWRRRADVRFSFTLSAQDQENLRWYLEEYLEKPSEPAPTVAAQVEQRMDEIGTELFRALFQANEQGRDIWSRLRDTLNDTRVEIITQVREAAAIPWELLRDPLTAAPLALEARAFVRTHHSSTRTPRLPRSTTPIRILLVISRPRRDLDVPFRSVASRLVKHLSGRDDFRLDVLRPPTFAELARVLRAAKATGEPYHVVHFDGHGTYGTESLGPNITAQRYADHRPGQHGYLLFEQPELKQNYDLVDGPTLGNLLAETDVPVLVLNACRSAHAEPADAPAQVGDAAQPDQPDPHSEVRSFGSLAQEVIDAGVAGVVAMRYNVFVVTAAQFVAELYGALIQGSTLGEAVSRGRKHLHAEPLREVVAGRLPLQDWSVPVVYEAAPIALFPPRPTAATLTISLDPSTATPTRGTLDPALPRTPDVGFFGRDETLLALDRAFDTQRVVLLHAFAGSGKTTTAAEFARWYALTGGIKDGYVIFTSFEQPLPLPRVLDTLGQRFGPLLEQHGIQWLALDDEQRRDVALQVLRQIPVLWIWDNVEPVAGFPAGTESRLSAEEQRALTDFLRDVRETEAKLLLTSRRDERGWLGDLPARIAMPPMPRPERVQLARAIAAKYSRQLTEIGPWEPLLQYTQGNPLTLTVVVGQALRDGLRTARQIEAFVAKLRAGEDAFTDDVQEGRSRSLGASLSYGFAHAFSEDERRQLALLHFFQGFVDVDALRAMGYSSVDWSLPEVRDLTSEAGIALLDRVTEIGLLTAYGNGYYAIHPALPWYFKSLFEQYYTTDEHRKQATRAFVEAMGWLGTIYHNRYGAGNGEVINVLHAEENNLLYGWRLARTHKWWASIITTMQGLRMLYIHTGRRVEWRHLVEEIVPDFVGANDGPLPGREEEWSLVTQYRVGLVQESRNWVEAERLQHMIVDWARQHTITALRLPPDSLNDLDRNTIRLLAVSVEELGHIQREQGQSNCIGAYEAATLLYQRIVDPTAESVVAFNLGHAYKNVSFLKNLGKAEYWYQRSLELRQDRDRLGRGQCLYQLGHVYMERFVETQLDTQMVDELEQNLNRAANFYYQSLNLLPVSAVEDLGVVHNALGRMFTIAGYLNRGLAHSHNAIHYMETANNFFNAGITRLNIAAALTIYSRFNEALLYAQAALRNFETYGAGAAADIEKTQWLIADIEQAMRGEGAAGAASD